MKTHTEKTKVLIEEYKEIGSIFSVQLVRRQIVGRRDAFKEILISPYSLDYELVKELQENIKLIDEALK